MFPYQVTPDIFSDTVSWFDSDASFPATNYVIGYLTGAMRYAEYIGWSVNLNNWIPFNGFIITDGASNQVPGPGIATGTEWATQALCEAANAGLYVVYEHVGGQIGMYLNDNPYSDNYAGSPNPTFGLLGSYSFSASVTTLSCANLSSTLTWATAGAVSVAIDQGIGTVSASGSLTVYPTTTTTYTLTVTYSDGFVITDSVVITVPGDLLFASVDGSVKTWYAGAVQAAGPYLIECCGGSYSYESNPPVLGWTVNGTEDIFIVNPAVPQTPGYYVTNNNLNVSQSNLELAPGGTGLYSTQALCALANAGLTTIYQHTGGAPIGVALNDHPYGDNVGGIPLVAYMIAGPGPLIDFTANGQSAINITAGQSVVLAWSIANTVSSASIDNGIGAIAVPSGSMTLNPTATTTYNLTAVDTPDSITQIASVTVNVYVPQAPTNLVVTSVCGGVTISWVTGLYGTEQLAQRSADASTWSTLATLILGAYTYDDTTATAGQSWYYRIANTDTYNPAYSNIVYATVATNPVTPTNLAVVTEGLSANLSWTAPTYAASYAVERSADGGVTWEVVSSTISSASFTDFGPLTPGVSYSWRVASAGVCNVFSSYSASVSAAPELCVNAFTSMPPPT